LLLYVPALQLVNMALPLPGPQNEPAGHGRHADTLLLPLNALYVPAWQSMQADEEVLPFDGLYVPAWQSMQADASEDPLIGLYVPALQFVNMALPLPGPQKEPLGHGRHTSTLLLPLNALYVPAWQSMQADGSEDPLFGLNVPSGQSVQVALPAKGLNVPGGHSSQGDPEKNPDCTTCREPAGQIKEKFMKTAPALPDWALQSKGMSPWADIPHPARPPPP